MLAMAATGCDSTKKLGIAGATCSASSDCTGDLQCVASTCMDLATKAARDKEGAAADAEHKKLADLQAAKDHEQKQAMDALKAELTALKAEQDRLELEKKTLDGQLNNVTNASEKTRLLAEKAMLDAQIAENAKTQTTNRGQPERKVTVKKNVEDPLEGL